MKVQYKELEDQLNALTKRSKECSDNLREKDAAHSHACQSNGWVSTIPAFTSVQGTWRARDVQSKVQRGKALAVSGTWGAGLARSANSCCSTDIFGSGVAEASQSQSVVHVYVCRRKGVVGCSRV